MVATGVGNQAIVPDRFSRNMSGSMTPEICRLGFVLLLLACLSLPAFGALVSRVDRQQISSGETLVLTVSLDQQAMFGEPDFSRLEADFEIVSRNRQSRYASDNGQVESFTHWLLTLIPRREGTLVIPSFSFKGEVSEALEIKVSKPASSLSSDAKIFTAAKLEKSSVYVQEQALLTLRLYTAVPLSDFSVSPLEVPDARVIKLADTQYQKRIGEMDYIVAETRYAIFPERSGELNLPGVRYSGVARLDYNRKRVTLGSEDQILSVKARPATTRGDTWLPAQNLELRDNWRESLPQLKVGEPVTRTIFIDADGLTSAQLPPLDPGTPDHIKQYSDQAQLEDNNQADGVRGRRVESMALVPTEAGTLSLPEISVSWWDTLSDSPRVAVLPARTLTVLPATGSAAHGGGKPLPADAPGTERTGDGIGTTTKNSVITNDQTVTTLLLVSNLLLLTLCSCFAWLWWRARAARGVIDIHNHAPVANTAASLKELRQAAAAGDSARLREAVIHWARQYWREPHLHTLDQVVQRARDPGLKDLFDQLDAQLYSKPGVPTGAKSRVDFTALIGRLEQLPKPSRPDAKHGLKTLEPLYPH